MFDRFANRLLLRLVVFFMFRTCVLFLLVLDSPTAKFGEALRTQVEERLNFFETGAPPSKNADAIRKVLDDLAMEDQQIQDEDEPALTTLEASPRKEKKKRKVVDMDVDEDEDEEVPTKKVKLSKEEKKALKRAKKEAKEKKAKETAANEEQARTTIKQVSKEVDDEDDEDDGGKKEKKKAKKAKEAKQVPKGLDRQDAQMVGSQFIAFFFDIITMLPSQEDLKKKEKREKKKSKQ